MLFLFFLVIVLLPTILYYSETVFQRFLNDFIFKIINDNSVKYTDVFRRSTLIYYKFAVKKAQLKLKNKASHTLGSQIYYIEVPSL